MRHFALAFLAIVLSSFAAAQQKPDSLVVNGGFEASGGWSLASTAKRVPSDRGGMCIEVAAAAGVTQEIPCEDLRGTYSVAVDVKTEAITPSTAAGGYAYAAIYQFGSDGGIVAFYDFIQPRGTTAWQHATYTFEIVTQAVTVSMRCGIYNASGQAWFDNWTLVAGGTPYSLEEVNEVAKSGRPATPTAAIFREPGLPVVGAASDPERLGRLLERGGFKVEYLSAAELSDMRRLRPERYHLVVLPYGQSFPAEARRGMTQFLHLGGSFISTGGYVFNKLLLHKDGQWADEATVVAAELKAALARSVLPDPGFEQAAEAPIGGEALDGQWRRDGDQCTIVAEQPHEGQVCAQVVVPPGKLHEQRWYLDLPPEKGGTYRISGWLRTENVSGGGFAYMAVYEYDDAGKLGNFRDFVQARGTNDWAQHSYDFTPETKTTRLHIKMGLYQANGQAWFDDIRLARVDRFRQQPMNTATGKPADGLQVAQWQVGAFDASFPLRRVAKAIPGETQNLFPAGGRLDAPLSGWAAAGVQGSDNARWVELLDGRDRFGRKRGAAGALMINYNGYFPGSMWAFFGAENRDLFDGQSKWLDDGLVRTAHFMARGVFLRNLKTDLAMYKPGEPVKVEVTVQNNGTQVAACEIAFTGGARWRQSESASVPPGESATVTVAWRDGASVGDLVQVRALLQEGGVTRDELRTGFVIERPETVAKGPELRLRDNYLTLNGRPTFLFGSDNYANTYGSSWHDPWTWHQEHVASRDYGFNLYEHLQYSNPDWMYSEAEWRKFMAMAQSCQREGQVFMPGYLIGQDVAIPEATLAKEAAQCQAYAGVMEQYPGLLHYINGDFQFTHNDKATLADSWNGWLAEKYGDAEKLKAAWGNDVYGEWGKLTYPPPGPPGWDSVREVDRAHFDVWVTTRWVQRHVDAIRSRDDQHPITSEYYQQPYGGLDLPLTIDGQDIANIGYFGLPETDVDNLPLFLRLNDLRARGKSLALGEYGVKTHPAWAKENGADHYHLVRTEEQQKQLFMAVAHYGLGMGASKVQNWCLRDASENCFPWGVFYPNGLVPKDVAYWHRNLSLVWRFFRPKYVPPAVTVMLPDGLRLGARGQVGIEVAWNAFRTLLDLHVDFNVLNERAAEALTQDTKLLVWPSPLCPDEATYQRVLQWVKGGGRLLVTGDLSYDATRQRTRAERLRELCGAEFVRELEAPPFRTAARAEAVTVAGKAVPLAPRVEVKPAGAKVEAAGAAGVPLLLRHAVGQGEVVYCTDGLELGERKDVAEALRALYAHAGGSYVPQGGKDLLGGLDADIRAARQPLAGGGEFVMAYNTNMAPDVERVTLPAGKGQAELRVAGRYAGFAATDGAGAVVAVGASGEAKLSRKPLLAGQAQVICLSLDGKALPEASAVLMCPFSAGRTALQSARKWQNPVMLLGDIQEGRWVTLATRPGKADLTLDQDTMTCLLLVCERAEQGKWTKLMDQAINRPWEVKGY